MRKTGTSVFAFGVAIIGTLLCVGCAVESGDGSESGADIGPASPESVAADPVELVSAPDGVQPLGPEEQGLTDDLSDKANYVYIQYCDYPNSWVGTRCIWSNGSNFCAAVSECISDTRSVCGSATSTWTIYTSAGDVTMSSARSACGL